MGYIYKVRLDLIKLEKGSYRRARTVKSHFLDAGTENVETANAQFKRLRTLWESEKLKERPTANGRWQSSYINVDGKSLSTGERD